MSAPLAAFGYRELPVAVQALASRLGARPGGYAAGVRLAQRGRMKRSLEKDEWLDFTANQTISNRACEFEWLAKAGPLGVVSARDALGSEGGRFEVKALGFIPLAVAKPTPELLRGELMRYLAEIAWAPDALLLNTTLRWRADGSDRLVVGAGAGASACEVTLGLDADGRIVSAFAPDRPRSEGSRFLPTPWRGRFSDYRFHAGRWIPFSGEVGWEIDGALVTYWQGHLTQWEG